MVQIDSSGLRSKNGAVETPDFIGEGVRVSMMKIAAVIRDERRQNRLTQLELAALAGVSERTIRDIEKARASVGIGTVLKVTAVLGLEVDVQ